MHALSPATCFNGISDIVPIVCPSTTPGALASTDCFLSDNSFFDAYSFPGFAGQQVTITMTSSAFDSYLFLVDPTGSNTVAQDDDSGGGTNSRIVFTLTETGTWFIIANSFEPNQFGPYTVTLGCDPLPPTPTPTPLPGFAADVPTLSLPAMLLLSLGLALAALMLMRRS